MGGERRERRDWPWIAALVAFGVLVHVVHLALLPFVLAAIVGFVTDPAIRWLQAKSRAPRWLAALGLFIVLGLAFGGLAFGVGRTALADMGRLVGGGPEALKARLASLIGPQGVELFGARLTPESLTAQLQAAIRRLLDPATAAHLAPAAFAGGVAAIMFVILSFYMMVSGPELARGAMTLAPPSRRAAVERVAPAMAAVLRRYFIGVLAIVAFTATAAWIGYALVMHVPGALLLSLALGVLETVPAVGPTVSAVLVTIAALQLHSLAATLVMIAYGVALRFTIDDVMAPLVLGRSVMVHPVVVMLAYVLGVVLFGVVGLLLAVPTAACIRIALADAYGEPAPGGSERH